VTAVMHVYYAKRRFTYDNSHLLKLLMYVGCFVQLAGVVSFVVYLVLGCLYQTGK